jgi:hypothetical protein
MTLTLTPRAPSPTIASVRKEREDNRINLEKLSARNVALTAERDSLRKASGTAPNPSDAYRLDALSDDLAAIAMEIKRGNRREEALAYELGQMELPSLRADADRLIDEALRAIELTFAAPIAKLRAQIFEHPATARTIELMGRANEAYSRAESAAGNKVPGRPADFGDQVGLVLRALYASNAQDTNQWYAMQKGALFPAQVGFSDEVFSQLMASRNFHYPVRN